MMMFRRILFLLLAVVFLLLCPLLVFHTLGYLNTGLVVVEALPRETTVWLNGRAVARKTPATVAHLPPGTYQLRVTSPGYHPWNQSVQVVKGKATVLDRVLLLPEAQAARTLAQGPFDALLGVDGEPYLVLMERDTAAAVVLNTRSGEISSLFPSESDYAAGTIQQIFAVAGSSFLLVRIKMAERTTHLWVNLDNETREAKEISVPIIEEAQHMAWSTEAPKALFSFHKGRVTKVDIEAKTVTPDFAVDWVGLGVVENTVCGLDSAGSFVRKDVDGAMLAAELTELELGHRWFRKPRFVRIFPLGDGSLLFHEMGGRLLQTELPHELVQDDVQGVRVYQSDQQALVWQRHALGLLAPSEGKAGETVFATGREIRWVYQGDADVSSPYFLYDGTYVICLLDATATVLALGNHGSSEPRVAFAVRKGTAIHYDDTHGSLYALHPDDARLVSLQLLARKPGIGPPNTGNEEGRP